MGLLDEFYGDGRKESKHGQYAAHIDHINDHSALMYNQYGEYEGRVDIYGDTIYRTDESGHLIQKGQYDEKLDKISIFDCENFNEVKEITHSDGKAYVTNRGKSIPIEKYVSSYSCNDDEDDDWDDFQW